jgi:hypothetical protein
MPPISKYTDKYILAVDGTVEKQADTFDVKDWTEKNVSSIVLLSDTIGNFTIETKFFPYDKNLESEKQYFFETRVNHSDEKSFFGDTTQKMMDELSAIYAAGGNFATTKEEALLNHAKILALIS